jgi:hypothetical protein
MRPPRARGEFRLATRRQARATIRGVQLFRHGYPAHKTSGSQGLRVLRGSLKCTDCHRSTGIRRHLLHTNSRPNWNDCGCGVTCKLTFLLR